MGFGSFFFFMYKVMLTFYDCSWLVGCLLFFVFMFEISFFYCPLDFG